MMQHVKETALTLVLALTFIMNAACAPAKEEAKDSKGGKSGSTKSATAAASKSEGEKLPTEKPSAQFYGKSRNAWQLFNQATYKTVAWPGKPKSWVRIRVEEGTLHMTPHEVNSMLVTALRVPLNIGTNRVKASALLKKECKYPVELRFRMGDGTKVDRKLSSISLKPGVETPISEVFEVVQAGRELVITVRMGEGAKDNFNSSVALKNITLDLK